MKRTFLSTACLFAITASTVLGQTQPAPHTAAGHHQPAATMAATEPSVVAGPHGGSVKQVGELLIESLVSHGGLQMFIFDRGGQAVSVQQGRGVVSLYIEGSAKRYRYDLLPDGKGALTAPVNLSQLAGHQIEVDVQLVGIPAVAGNSVRFREVATVPFSETQLAAAAISRQKICPVSGKPLGSMGAPVAVDVGGQSVFVCCAGCVNAVKSEPSKYAAGRPEITVTSASPADAAAIALQKVCPVMDEPLGGMGTPVKVSVGDKSIYLCCKGCVKKVQAEPAKYIAMVHGASASASRAPTVAVGTEQVREGVFKVASADAPFIAAQGKCPVMDEPLEAMGGPYKVNAAGRAIYICCPGCAKKVAADPQKYVAILKAQGIEAPTLR